MSEIRYFHPVVSMSVGEAAALSGAELLTPEFSHVMLTGMGSLDRAGPNLLTFIAGKSIPDIGADISAGAVVCNKECSASIPAGIAILVSSKPKDTFALIGRALFPSSVHSTPFAVQSGALGFVDPTAHVEAGVLISVGAVVGHGVEIGAGTSIGPNTVIGPGCKIGRDCSIGPSVTVTNALIGNHVFLHPGVRIGQDGFGFVPGKARLEKMPHIGRVIIQDDVEIGANSTVDRGMLDDTVIGEGTKIDNLVQIGHNVHIGRHCVIAGLCGISGSVVIGDWVMLGGNSGIADHVSIGDGAQIAARAGVMNDVPAGQKWAGAPAQPLRDFFREVSAIRGLVKDKKGKKL